MAGSKKKFDALADSFEKRLPSFRNYWRFGTTPSPPQRPPSYLLNPHLIASNDSSSAGRNPNSKYYKLRHGPGAMQYSPLSDDIVYNYRVRPPFDPSPFRGVARFVFWILFISILLFLLVLIIDLFRFQDFSEQTHDVNRTNNNSSFGKGIIFQTLLEKYHKQN